MRSLKDTKNKVEWLKRFAAKNNLTYMEALETIKFMYHIEDMEEIKNSLNCLKDR